ncbi:hypothetical protein PLICRDRAFT_39179 [Plicaturopsis crispa FD-325 SS-3]|nr:hypothetical protein PLICRDRAFT_39179 [Plicaturopsis crispa FD-325 SS-3]
MSQYYTPPSQHAQRRQYPSLETDVNQQSFEENLADSIYIFPNPPSAPASPSFSSEFSAPTDVSLSGLTVSRESSGVHDDWSRSTGSDSDIARSPLALSDGPTSELWEWVADERSADAEERELDEEYGRRPSLLPIQQTVRDRAASLRRGARRPLRSGRRRNNTCSSQHKPSSPSPHAPIHLPLLSWVTSLISVDDATLHLLRHSSSRSALFSGPSIDPDPASRHNTPETPHGMHKLLTADADDKKHLREGLFDACDPSVFPINPFFAAGFGLGEIWNIVSGVWTNGGKAWREVVNK